MTAPATTLRRLRTDLGADVVVLARHASADAHGVVLAADPPHVVHAGEAWLPVPETPDVVSDPHRVVGLLPLRLRLSLADPAQAVLVRQVVPPDLYLVVAWCGSAPQRSAEQLTAQLDAGLATDIEIWDLKRRADLENSRFAAVVNALPQAVVVVDEVNARAFGNPTAVRLLDLPGADVSNATLSVAMGALQARADNAERVVAQAAPLLSDPRATLRPLVWEFATSPTHLSVSSHPVGPAEAAGRVWVFEDVSAAFDRLGEVRHRAKFDQLTGLLNRAEVLDIIRAVASHGPRTGTATALAYCDLDGFKAVNDTLGHAVGDTVLREVADRLKQRVRTDDIVARMGGDELLVLLSGVHDLAGAVAVAEQLRRWVTRPIEAGAGEPVFLDVSIGVTLIEPGEDVGGVLARADAAMYRAKQQGRGRVVGAPAGSLEVG